LQKSGAPTLERTGPVEAASETIAFETPVSSIIFILKKTVDHKFAVFRAMRNLLPHRLRLFGKPHPVYLVGFDITDRLQSHAEKYIPVR
jgi:hypothetical protein